MAVYNLPNRGSYFGIPVALKEFDSNVTLAKYDLVNVSSNQLELAATGEVITGQVLEAATSASTGVSIDITPYLTVILDNDETGSTLASTDPWSSYFDIAGTTGAQLVDISTRDAIDDGAGSGQVMCLEYNPQGYGLDSDTSIGLYMLHETGI